MYGTETRGDMKEMDSESTDINNAWEVKSKRKTNKQNRTNQTRPIQPPKTCKREEKGKQDKNVIETIILYCLLKQYFVKAETVQVIPALYYSATCFTQEPLCVIFCRKEHIL